MIDYRLVILVAVILAARPEEVIFSRDIAPLLQQKCLICHDAEKLKGGYSVENYEQLLRSGKSGLPAVTPGVPEQSELYTRLITHDEDERMPQKDDKLAHQKSELIRQWILAGAKLDLGTPTDSLTSFLPVQHPVAPEKYPFPMPVLALAFNEAGTELLVGGYHEVTVWSVAEGKLLNRLSHLPQRIHALAPAPNGHWFFLAGGTPGQSGEIAMKVQSSTNAATILMRTPDEMLSVAIGPHGKLLAAGGSDHGIHIFDTQAGDRKISIMQHADWVTSVSFSPDGEKVLSSSRDRTVRIYLAATGHLETTYTEHSAAVYAAAFSTDGKSAVSAGRGKSIHLWNVEDGKKRGEIGRGGGDIYRLVVAGDSVFSAGADGLAREHSIDTKKERRIYAGHKEAIYALAHHAGASLIAAGAHDGSIKIWSTLDGKLVSAFAAQP